MRPLFENIPFPLTFKVHIFNITNPVEFANGNKPKIEEIGPYVFEYVFMYEKKIGKIIK